MFFYIEFPRALGRSEAPLTKMFAPCILKLDAPWAYTRLPVVSVTKKKQKALNWVVLNCSVPVNFFKWEVSKTI